MTMLKQSTHLSAMGMASKKMTCSGVVFVNRVPKNQPHNHCSAEIKWIAAR